MKKQDRETFSEVIEQVLEGSVDGLFELALLAHAEKKTDIEEQLHLQALARGKAESGMYLGYLYGKRRQLKKAERYYAAAFESGIEEAAVYLAVLLEKEDEFSRAATWYEKVSDLPRVPVLEARNLRALGHEQEADALIARRADDDPEAAVELVLYQDTLSDEEALQLLKAHWNRRSEDENSYLVGVTLGNLLCDFGSASEGVEVYEEAARQGDAHAVYNLGVEILDEDPEAAVRWIRTARRLGDKRARKWLKKRKGHA
jgi:TPR repeat protein